MKNLKMAQKLGLGFGSVTLLICLISYMSYSALNDSSDSIIKIAEVYIPASDSASNVLDDVRTVRYFMLQFETAGKKEYFDMAINKLGEMAQEFEKLQKLSVANPELSVLATTVREFPPLFKSYKEGCEATAKHSETVAGLLKAMIDSAGIAEKATLDLEKGIHENQVTHHKNADADNLFRSSNNIHTVSNVALLFKEVRRLYANARLTQDTGVKVQVDALGVEIFKELAMLEGNLRREVTLEQHKIASNAIKTYLGDMTNLISGWEKLNAATQVRRDVAEKLVTLQERLNLAANSNAITFAQKADKQSITSTTRVLSVAAGAVVLAILLSLVITRMITGPLGRGMRFAQAVAQGNLDEVLDVQSRDEVGKLADALRSMVTSLKAKIQEADEQAVQARKMGDEARVAMEEAKKAQAAAESAKREGMLAAAGQLEGIVEVVSSASTELSAQVEESERGMSITAERIAETATAMEEMNATVLEVARSAGNAAGVSTDAKTKAEHGAGIVDNVVRCITDVERQSHQLKTDMEQLGQQAEAIGTIMNVISDIADQTNLLALNAAIEAARAGEAGRGFAVVADEVRKLAEKTMQATVEVGNAIKGVQRSAEKNMRSVDASSGSIAQATDLVRQAGISLKEIVDLVESSADQVRTIATAAEEQSSTSEEINRALGTINSASSETARAMAEAAQAVSDLSQQAQRLARLIEEMKRA